MEGRDDVVAGGVHRAAATARRTVLLVECGHRVGPGVDRETAGGSVEASGGRRGPALDGS